MLFTDFFLCRNRNLGHPPELAHAKLRSGKMQLAAVFLASKGSSRNQSIMNPRHLIQAVVFVGVVAALVAAQDQASTPRPQEIQSHASEATRLPEDANQYVRTAVQHELAEQDRDHSHWRYSLHREDSKGSQDRDVIETTEGSLSRTLLKWGRPLTAQEQQEDEARIQRQISDPDERAKHAKREKKDAEKARQMLRAIPEAFTFSYDGEDSGLVRLAFIPNPHFEPPNFEQRVFRSMHGKLWIDHNSSRLARIEGELFEDVNIGFGLLGHLNKGGTFKVVRKDVGEGNWEIISEEVNMTGRAAIFKTISEKQKQLLTGFRRVPDSLSLREAYQMLSKDPNSVSANNDHAEVRPQGKN
jgi:hypothetical protein